MDITLPHRNLPVALVGQTIEIIVGYFCLLASFYILNSLLPVTIPASPNADIDLRTFALIVYANPYCARNSCRNATPRHASSARAEETFQPHIG